MKSRCQTAALNNQGVHLLSGNVFFCVNVCEQSTCKIIWMLRSNVQASHWNLENSLYKTVAMLQFMAIKDMAVKDDKTTGMCAGSQSVDLSFGNRILTANVLPDCQRFRTFTLGREIRPELSQLILLDLERLSVTPVTAPVAVKLTATINFSAMVDDPSSRE